MTSIQDWSPGSWRRRTAVQLPVYPDAAALAEVTRQLRAAPPLIFAGEIKALRARFASVAKGESFLLQGGDCAESFDNLGAASNLKCNTLPQVRCADAKPNFIPTTPA
jgi:3-deoxy-7-phosphoheptulonate synthase